MWIRWLARAVGWDGVLPSIVWATPFVIRGIAPGNRRLAEIALLVLPVIAVLVRYYAGRKAIDRQQAGKGLRRCQQGALLAAIGLLLLLDAWWYLTFLLPADPATWPFSRSTATRLYVVYFLLALFAMYPGNLDRRLPPVEGG
ncbi:MAG: hypothetical protein ACKN94_01635 [Pirellulaceae bacterium]